MSGGVDHTRTLALWCPNWAVVAAGAAPHEPVAVLRAGSVVAATPAACAEGVQRGQRRREAQARCARLSVLDADEAAHARAFEAVLAAVEAFTPAFELIEPGDCALGTRGPARYFGGEQRLAERIWEAVDEVLAARGWGGELRLVVADGARAARLLVRHLDAAFPLVVPAGATADTLAPLPVDALGIAELADLLGRLGLPTLGAFASLDPADVLVRFGSQGLAAHRLARGVERAPPLARVPSPELAVTAEVDPPAERSDRVAFVAKALADELAERLAGRGSSAERVAVEIEAEHGERCARLWRHDGVSAGLVDRVRWQLDGWCGGPIGRRPCGGVVLVRLVPDGVGPASGRQLGFWGEQADADQRVTRAVARIEGLLGAGAVSVLERRGGRSPADQVARLPAAAAELRADRRVEPPGVPGPWPGAVPEPHPASVHAPELPIEVVDATGRVVAVDARGAISAAPHQVRGHGVPGVLAVADWAGPWPADERWWDTTRRRRARLQLVLGDGTAVLVAVEHGRWWHEATYD